MTDTSDIVFNRASVEGNELEYVQQSIESGHTSSSGSFAERASASFGRRPAPPRCSLTTSCTIGAGDERAPPATSSLATP